MNAAAGLVLALAVSSSTFTFTSPPPTFRDQASMPFATPAITVLAAEGVVKGFPDHTFRPSLDVSRAQFAALLDRLTGLRETEPLAFRDVGRSSFAAAAIAALAERGIVQGISRTHFAPGLPVSRLQAVVWIARALHLRPVPPHFSDAGLLPAWAAPLVGAAQAAGIAEGVGGAFKPNAVLTRADAVALLLRTEAELGPGAGTPMGLAGRISGVLYPDDPQLAAAGGSEAGAAGSILLDQRTVPMAAGARIFRDVATSTLFGLGQGDLVVAALDPAGKALAIADVVPRPAPLTVVDASQNGTLYLSDGATMATPQRITYAGAAVTLRSGPSELIGDTVREQAGGLSVTALAVHDLVGTVTAASPSMLTLRIVAPTVLADFLPALGVGATVTVGITAATTMAPAAPGNSLQIGTTVTVLGSVAGDTIEASTLVY